MPLKRKKTNEREEMAGSFVIWQRAAWFTVYGSDCPLPHGRGLDREKMNPGFLFAQE